jgi:hypothetical protein
MKAQFINEKFEKDSDPVQDMGIGGFRPYIEYDTELKPAIDKWKEAVISSIKGKVLQGVFTKGTTGNVNNASFVTMKNREIYVKAVEVYFVDGWLVIVSPNKTLYRLMRNQKYIIKEFKNKEV